MTQQGDVLLYQTDDDGDITVEGGTVTMSGGLETAAYLSLFGGNEDDDGRDDNPLNWWGNIDEVEPANRYRSETQNLLQAIVATSANLLRVEAAAQRDLAWLLSERVASSVTVSASIPALNRVRLTITIEANGVESDFDFVENWKAAA
jgi:phage gp46-like protein